MRFLILGVFLIAGYVAVYAGAVAVSKDRIVREIITAVEAGHTQKLSQRIGWGALRSHLVSDIRAQIKAYGGGMDIVVPIGPKPEDVVKIVDAYVQPERLVHLMALRKTLFPDRRAQEFIMSVNYEGPFAFSIILGYPGAGKKEEQPTFTEALSTVKLVFTAYNWSWRVTEIHAPLYMFPRDIYTEAEIERLLSSAKQQAILSP